MKRLISLVVVSWLLTVAPHTQGQKTKPEAVRETVAVFVIDNRQYGYGYGSYYDSYTSGYYNDWQRQLVENLQVELQSAIENTEKWTVVDWQRLGHVISLQDQMRSGRFDPETIVRTGKLFGVRWAIYVAIEHFAVTSDFGVDRSVIFNQGLEAGFRKITVSLVASAWMVDVERGIVRNAIRAIKATESSQVGAVRVPLSGNRFFVTKQLGVSWLKAQPGRATRLMAGQLAAKLTSADLASFQFKPRLLVAKVDGKTVFLNQGETTGIKVGDRYLAASGQPVKDPDSGAVLGYTDYVIIEVISVQPNFATAKVISGSSSITVGTELNPYRGTITEAPADEPDSATGSSDLAEPSSTPAKKEWDYEFPLKYGYVTVGDADRDGVIYRDNRENELARFSIIEAVVNDKIVASGLVQADGLVLIRIKLKGNYKLKGDEQWYIP